MHAVDAIHRQSNGKCKDLPEMQNVFPAELVNVESTQSKAHFPLDTQTRNTIRIIRILRDDIQRLYPEEFLPSSWMIKCLVLSCKMSHSFCSCWSEGILKVLQQLVLKTEYSYDIRHSFFEVDGVTPLFPNNELFSPQHTNRFARIAIQHVKMQFGKEDSSWPAAVR